MEALTKKFSQTPTEQTLIEIQIFLTSNPIESILPNLNNLINALLTDKTQDQAKYPILTFIIDLFLNMKIPPEQLSSLSFEKLFSHDGAVYQINSNSNMIEAFFSKYYPNQEFVSTLSKETPIDCDFLLVDNSFTTLTSWTRGKVMLTEDEKIVQVNLEELSKEIQLNKKTVRIQPFKRFSDDYEWRTNIKAGDEVDFLDSTKTWYLNTVLERKPNSNKIKIGCRVYRDCATLEDSQKRKFIGWSEKFDMEINIHDSRIRKPLSYSRDMLYLNTYSTYPNDNKKFNPCQLYIPFDDKFYVIPKEYDKKNFNLLYLDICNYFMKSIATKEDCKLYKDINLIENFDYFSTFCYILHKLHEKFNTTFAINFLRDFYLKATDTLLQFAQTESRNVKKTTLQSLLKKMKEIMNVAYFENDFNSLFSTFGIQFGMNCFKTSTILEKQLLGISILCDSLNNSGKKLNTQELILSVNGLLSNEPNIFASLYESSLHTQIIQKSYDIINPLFQMKLITEKHCNQLIKYLEKSKDYDIENVIYKLFSSNANHLSIESIEQLLLFIFQKQQNINTKDLSLLMEIARAPLLLTSKDLMKKISRFVFDLIIENKFTIDANKEFCEFLKIDYNPEIVREEFLLYFSELINKITKDNFENALKLMKTMIASIPKDAADIVFQEEIYKLLFIKKNIFNEIIDYFNTGAYNPLILEFITYVLNKLEKTDLVTNDMIQRLFELFSTKLNKHNSDFFKWLKEIEEGKKTSSESLEFLFKVPIPDEVSQEHFNFLLTLFYGINNIKTEGEIIKETNKVHTSYTGVTSTGKILYSYSYTPNEKEINMKTLNLPKNINAFDLKYFDVIWITLINMKAEEEKIKKEALSDFYRLFSQKDLTLEQRKDIWIKLIDKTMVILTNPSSSICFKKNAINILSLLIEESELKGTGGCISHQASMKSNEITLHIIDNIKNNDTKKTLEYDLVVSSNTTIWDLKKLLAIRNSFIPEYISIKASDTEITDRENGKLISEKFCNLIKLTVTKNLLINDIPKAALMKDGDLSPKAKEVFITIFNRYSEDGKMTRDHCGQLVAVAIDSQETIPGTDTRVATIVDKYAVSSTEDYIILKGFLKFFYDAIEVDKKIMTVWDNIKAFGFRNDLKQIGEPLDDSLTDNDGHIMPRSILSQEKNYFETLFLSQDCQDKDLMKEVNKLINMICTNKKFYNMVLEQGKEWEEFLTKETNEFILHYLFQIIESFFETKQNETKKKWLNDFIVNNAFENLIKTKFLNESIDKISSKVSLSIRKIIINGLEILMNIEAYDCIINKRFLNDELVIDRQSISLDIKPIDETKYPLTDIFNHLIKCIEEMQNKEKFEDNDGEISKRQLNILAIIFIYFKGDISTICPSFNIEQFLLNGLLYGKDKEIRKQFCFTFGLLFLEINIDSFRENLLQIIERKALDFDLMKQYDSNYFLVFYEFIWKIHPIKSEKTEIFANEIIKCLSTNLNNNVLLNYFKLLNNCLDSLSKDYKTRLCQEGKLMNKLVETFLIEDLDNKESNKGTSDVLFSIIHKLIIKNPANFYSFFSLERITNLSQYITQLKPGKENYSPSIDGRSSINNYIGIQNLRNTCYINSVIQQFFNVSAFKYGILAVNDNLPPNKTEIEDDNLLHQLQRMFTFLQLSQRHEYIPNDFVYSFKDIDNNPTDFTIQCDAQEFLSRFMEKIETILSKTTYKNLMKGIFYGETCSQLICQKDCGSIRNRFEELIYLSLDIKQIGSLHEALTKYITEEIIDDFYCEQCLKKTKQKKRISLNKLPNVLFIHLQRISFNYETFLMEKINSRLEFPMSLDMKPYTTENISPSVPEDNEFDLKVYEHEDDYYKYELKGVVVHSGTAQFGHYYSFINTELGNKEKWLRFDDGSVYSYSPDKLVDDTFGGNGNKDDIKATNDNKESEWEESSKGAYMLVYERKLKAPLHIITNEVSSTEMSSTKNEDVNVFLKESDPFNSKRCEKYNDSFLDCEDTASSRKEYQLGKPHLVQNDNIQIIPYYHFLRNSSNMNYDQKYFNEVRRDNIIFKNDKSIYYSSFCEFIKKCTMELSTKSVILEKEKTEIVFKTISQLLINTLTKYSNKGEINETINNMIQVMKDNPSLAIEVLKEFMNNPKRYIFTFILTFEDKLNLPFRNYLTQAIILAMKDDDHSEEAIKVLDYLFSLIPLELSKNWTKMVVFLEIFEVLTQEGNENIIKYLFEKDTIKILIDFMLAKDSPLLKQDDSRNEMGNKTVSAKFAPLIATIAALARRCTNLIGEKYENTFITSSNEYNLTEDDKLLLTCNAFYKKIISESYHNGALSKLLAHLMYNDLDFTEKRIYSLIDLISGATASTEVKNVFTLLFNILTLEDNHIMYRYEAIMGIPLINLTTIKDKPSISGIKFRSTLFPNKDTLIEKMCNKWKTSGDNIMFIAYLYGLVFAGNKLFNYYLSLPSPKTCSDSLNDFIIQQAKHETNWLKTCQYEKKYENYMEIIEKCKASKFDNKLIEIKDEQRIAFYPKVKLGKILTETIVHIPDEEFNQQECYLLRCDYVVEINPEVKDDEKKEDEPIVLKAKYDTKDAQTKTDEYIEPGIAQQECTKEQTQISKEQNLYESDGEDKTSVKAVCGDEESANATNVNSSKNLQANLQNQKAVEHTISPSSNKFKEEESKDEEIIDNKTIGHYPPRKDNEGQLQMFSDIMKNGIKSETVDNYPTVPNRPVTIVNENNYYLENIATIIKDTETLRLIEDKPSQLSTITLRSYIIVNNSDKEFKTSIRICDTNICSYVPQSTLINFLKKKASTQVMTLLLEDNKPNSKEDLTFICQIEQFEITNNDLLAELYENPVIKKSKSFDDKKLETLVKDLEPPNKKKANSFEIEKPSDNNNGGCEINCPTCFAINFLTDGDVEMKCTQCKAYLFG